jgi:spermidine synthase
VTPTHEVFGGGAYDGAISTSLESDKNMIVRAYGISALHPAPKEVLMIGLSTGAWAQVIANLPGVEKLTVIEINRGYLELIPRYPEVASVLRNPKVDIVIDDGRRWLVHHPERTFDVIVSNTTFHWRANTTNLLSLEFLQAVRAHLKPGGIFHFNTTGSADAYKTAFTIFPYGLRFINFATVSDSPIVMSAERWKRALDEHEIDGKPTLDSTRAEDRRRRDDVLALVRTLDAAPVPFGLESRETALRRLGEARVITDDNMVPEWRGAGEVLFPPHVNR